MTNIVLILVIVLIFSGAGYYIYREKKKGKKCIGCPYNKECTRCKR